MDWIMVSAVAMVILVIVTGIYAYLTNLLFRKYGEMVEFMREDRERPQIVEQVKNVISPFITQLNIEISLLEKGEYRWYHDGKEVKGIEELAIPYDKMLIFDNFKRNHLNIVKRIDSHNEKVSILEEKIKDLDKAIYTSDFKEKCNQLIKKYNEMCLEKHKIKNEDIGYLPGKIVERIIENNEEKGVESRFRYFWKDNKDKLLKIRGGEGVKDKIEDLDIFSNQLKSMSDELRNSLETLRRKYIDEHNLTLKETKETDRYILT